MCFLEFSLKWLCGAYLPVVKVLPHILGHDHNQVIYVVVFIRRDPCTKIKYVDFGWGTRNIHFKRAEAFQ